LPLAIMGKGFRGELVDGYEERLGLMAAEGKKGNSNDNKSKQ